MVCYGVSLWLVCWFGFWWVSGVCFVLLFALFCCLLYFWVLGLCGLVLGFVVYLFVVSR